jgi:hypothetical protein
MKAMAIRFMVYFLGFGLCFFACSSKTGLDDELLGTWKATKPEYQDAYFELKPDRITFGDREGGIQSYVITRIKRGQYRSSQWLIYTVTYQNENLQKMEFSFFCSRARTDTLILKNQKDLVWKKAKQGI